MSNSLRNLRIVLKCKSVFQEEAAISHRVFIRLVGLIVLAPLAPTIMFSQATQLGFSNSPPSFGHGHDYIQQFNETVNPADGSLTLRIGVPTPPGRGLNFPYALTYNSSSIHGFYQPPPPGPGQSGPMLMQWAYPSFIATTAQGWSDTLPRLVAQHTPYFEGYTNPYGDQSIYMVTCEGWQGLQFTDLSGQAHQPNLSASFTYDESTGCNTATPGTYNMAADGTVQGYVQVGGFADFATPDGTHYEYGLSSDLPSGTFVFFPLLIEDKNGNKLTIGNATLGTTGYTSLATCGSPCTISPLTVTDTLGRTVISLQPVDAHHESLSVSGIPNPYTITFASGAGSTGTAIPQASYNYATGSTANTIPAMPALSGGVSSLGLPDGGSYSFSYDPVFGNVNKVTYPNGGYVSYTWGFPSGYSDNATYKAPYIACEGGCSSYNPASQQVYVQYSMPVILSRTVSFDGQNTALSQTFNYQTTFRPGDMIDGWISKTTTVTTNDLVAGTTSSVIYSYSPFSEMAQNPTQRYTGQTAQEYQAVYKDSNGNVLQTVCKSWIGDADLLYTQTTILPNGMVSEHVFSYGGIGAGYGYVDVPNGDDYYDFSAPQSNPTCANPQVSLVEPAPGPLLTSTRQNLITATTSLYPYGPSIVNTPSSTITKDGSGNTVAETDYQYTNAIAQTVSGVVQHDTAFDNSSQVRQNLLSTTKQCFPSCTSVTTTYSYDNTGQVVSATDGRGNTTNYSYADTYTGNAGQPSSVTNAYVTTVTAPSTLGAQHIQRATYGFNDGKIRSLMDENSNVTTFCYWTSGCSGSAYDPWMRLTQIQYPDGGSKSATYNDAGSSPTVVSSTVLNSSSTLVQTAIGDGMGHVIHSQTNSDPEGPTTVDTVYGGTGAVFSISNPYRSTGDPSYGVTSYTYDGLGRKIIQRQPDGSMLQWCYNGIASSSAQTICTSNLSSISNTTWVDAADEAGHHSQQGSDGASRLVAVMEPDPGTNVPNLETDYGYDPLGNLKTVTQHGKSGEAARTRSFTYDSLSRLLTSTNPETGTICYGQWNGTSCANGYDANGNLRYKTDARNVTTTYTYDALNRLTSKTYSDGTASAHFNYDETGKWGATCGGTGFVQCNTIGRLTSTYTGDNSTGSIFGYDAMGRTTMKASCIGALCGNNPSSPSDWFQQSFSYDLAGNPTSNDFGTRASQAGSPLGVLGFTYDGAGRLSTASTGQSGAPNLFTATAYTPVGIANASLGNGTTEAWNYDNRMRAISYNESLPNAPGDAAGSAPPTGVVAPPQNPANQTGVVAQGDDLHVQGWAASPVSGCAIASVEVWLSPTAGSGGQLIGDADMGFSGWRYDPGFTNCGFDFNDSVGDIAPGNYYVKVFGIDAAGNRNLLYNQYQITVTASAPPNGWVDGAVNTNNGSSAFVDGGKITVNGWAIDSQLHAPVSAVMIMMDAQEIGFATLGQSRPDVVAGPGNGDPSYLLSGWTFTGSIEPVGYLAPGTHAVTAVIYDALGQHYSPTSSPKITVTADTETTDGRIDTLNGVDANTPSLTVNYNSTVTLSGWSVDPSQSDCGQGQLVEIWLGEHLVTTAQRGVARPDVGAGQSNPACGNAGWTATASLTGITPGYYLLTARLYDASGGSNILPSVYGVLVQGVAAAPTQIQTTPLSTKYAWSVGYEPNGNVAASYDSVNGNWAYLYDNLNRLATAGGSGGKALSWQYDSFGNMLSQTVTAGMGMQTQHTYSGGTNRTDGLYYDAAGNQLGMYGSNEFAWDAESRMRLADNVGYLYDAEGQRVGKFSGNTLTAAYLYDAGGRMVTAMDGSFNPVRREAYAGGRHLGTFQGTLPITGTGQMAPMIYALTDWLGTERARADGTGTVCETSTSQPFGDNQQSQGNCFASPVFLTGKERDTESGLDYFGARYYASNMGRWMSPDWADKPEAVPYSSLDNPQSLNLYGYVGNNPLSRADADGHCCSWDEVKDFAVGTLKGTVASLTGGAMGSSPSMNDSAASLNGQIFGSAGVTAAGIVTDIDAAGKVGGGMLLAPETGGTSLVISGAGVAEGVVGTALIKGGSNNAAAVGDVMAQKQSGSYTNTHESGMTYDGKGSPERAAKSGARVEAQTGDKHVSTDHTPSPNDREGFKGESRRLDSHGGAGSDTNHNKIESPGKNYRKQDGSN